MSVVARTITASASCAFVIQALVPFKIQWSPSSVAVQDAAPASEPLPGSDNAKHPFIRIHAKEKRKKINNETTNTTNKNKNKNGQ